MEKPLLKCAIALLMVIPASLFTGCSTTASNSDRITVTFWHGMESGINNKILQAKIDEFNAKHPKIFIDAQVYGAADQLGPKLDAAVAGKTPPDLLWWAPAFFPKYADAGVLRSVDDFIKEDMALVATQALPMKNTKDAIKSIAEMPAFNKSDIYDF